MKFMFKATIAIGVTAAGVLLMQTLRSAPPASTPSASPPAGTEAAPPTPDMNELFPISHTQPSPQAKPKDCPTIGPNDRRTIVKVGSRDRYIQIDDVAKRYKLPGQFCFNAGGKVVWISDSLANVEEALRIYKIFKDEGLVKTARRRSLQGEQP